MSKSTTFNEIILLGLVCRENTCHSTMICFAGKGSKPRINGLCAKARYLLWTIKKKCCNNCKLFDIENSVCILLDCKVPSTIVDYSTREKFNVFEILKVKCPLQYKEDE